MRLTRGRSALTTLALLLLAVVSVPVAASEVGAKAMFVGEMGQLGVSPSVGTLRHGLQASPEAVPQLESAAPTNPDGERSASAARPVPEARPIAVRYCLRRVDGAGRVVGDASLGEVFRSGDRVQLTVEANSAGHLAIVQEGSDGHRGLLYPPPDGDLGSAAIEARSTLVLPTPRHAFTFDATPGTERLWLVLARTLDELAALPLRAEMTGDDVAALGRLVARETGAKNLVVEALTEPGDPCTYAAHVSGRMVVQEIALAHR